MARAAETAARAGREERTRESLVPERVVARGTSLARDPYARPRRIGEAAPEAPAYEVTSVAVLPAEEEPAETLDGQPPVEGDGVAAAGASLAGLLVPPPSDLLPEL